MNVKKILCGTILSAAVCFSACSEGNAEVTETGGETVTAAEETISAESETEAAAAEQSDNFRICGNAYGSEDIYIEIDGNRITEKGMENIRRMKKLSAVSIENPNVPLVKMFAEDPNITKIELVDFDGDISEYIDLLKSFDIVVINSVNYSGRDSALMYGELSDVFVRYEKNSDRLFDLPTEGIAPSVPAAILPRGSDGFDTWNAPIGELTVGISNFTDKKQTAQKLEIFYEGENGDEAVVFRNGESYLELDVAAAPLGEAEFTVDDTVFDYKSAANGVYKVRVAFENDTAEAEFVIANSDGLEFLTAEQRELFDRTREFSVKHTSESWMYSDSWKRESEPVQLSEEALETVCGCYTYDYAAEHSDRFSVDGSGGLYENDWRSGSPVYEVTLFSPISVSDERVDFKATVVNSHGDDPYFVWFYELNYSMVRTDDGWRFDKFQFWR